MNNYLQCQQIIDISQDKPINNKHHLITSLIKLFISLQVPVDAPCTPKQEKQEHYAKGHHFITLLLFAKNHVPNKQTNEKNHHLITSLFLCVVNRLTITLLPRKVKCQD